MELSDEGATLVLMMHDTGGEELYVLVSIYDIVCCVLALMLEQGLFRNQALTNEKNFLTQLVHMQEEQYRTSKANVEMVNIKCHDISTRFPTSPARPTPTPFASWNRLLASTTLPCKQATKSWTSA